MRKYLIGVLPVVLYILNTPAEGVNTHEMERREEEFRRFRGPSTNDEIREEYVPIDTKKVSFTHRRHQKIIKDIGKDCTACHHKRREGEDPRACRRCHQGRKVVSKGKYTKAGKKLKQKDIFHLLCGECHRRMYATGFRRADGSPGAIPYKCHHCHVRKE